MSSDIWPARDELQERLLAIEAVCCAYPTDIWIVEHLLVSLVAFLNEGRLPKEEVVQALMGFISDEPARRGAVEAIEFVAGSLHWEELRIVLQNLQDSKSADSRNRGLARSALQAFNPDWRGGAYRTFKK